MKFTNDNYYNPMDREYSSSQEENSKKRIEAPLFSVSEIGQTVTEGRAAGGNFIQSITAAIRKGAGRLELATMMEGSDIGVGAESYGKDSREAIRELAKVNEVKLHSIHTPSQIGNVSGMTQQGFSDEARDKTIQEVNKSIDFARDVTNGASIVIHTGEFPRGFAEQNWNKDEKFQAYEEEPEKAVMHVVDDRTGQIMTSVKKNQIVARPVWNRFDEKSNAEWWDENNGKNYKDAKGNIVEKGDYVDYEGNKVDRIERMPQYISDENDPNFGRIRVVEQGWDHFVKDAEEHNIWKKKKEGRVLTENETWTPEEAFIKASLEVQEGHAKGWALQYSSGISSDLKRLKQLRKAKEYWVKVEEATAPEDKWRLKKEMHGQFPGGIVPPETKYPVEYIDKTIKETEKSLEYHRQAATSQEQQAMESRISQDHAISISKFAKGKSFDTLAKTGLHALSTTKEEQRRRDDREKETGLKQDKMNAIFVAPENIFPEMGYGSHPEELIALVDGARNRMVELLTAKEIKGNKWNIEEKEYEKIKNPNYNPNMSKEKATKLAENHIKATFDTQHLGMWRKHFKQKPGETQEQTDKRFEGWYMGQVEKMEKSGIIGNIHIVDGWGRGHTHLPAGQGGLPVVKAVEYLKRKGYTGAMSSEGFGEPTRQLTETWRAFGANVYGGKDQFGFSVGAPAQNWANIEHSYLGKNKTPYFVFGGYSPSNDWTLWSQTPME